MNESNERDDARTAAELRSLDSGTRDVLAVLAVCGRASLSAEELGEITAIPATGLAVALAELGRRGLVVRDGDRFSLAPPKRGRLRRLLASVDVGDRVLRGLIQIAEDGRLTLADLDAVVELTRIAAEMERWKALLRLVDAAETTLSVTHRVEEWVEIVKSRQQAARALHDRDAARRSESELDRLRVSLGGGVGPPTALTVLAAAAAAAVGVGAGYLISNASSGDSTETVTETAAGKTVTEATETVTEATETVTEAAATVTETTTATVTTTTTVFETPTPDPTGGVD